MIWRRSYRGLTIPPAESSTNFFRRTDGRRDGRGKAVGDCSGGNMKKILIGALLAASGFAMASDATYELRRVTVSGNGTADKSEINCQISPGQIQHLSKVSGIASSQSGAFTTDEAAVQKLADDAVSLNRLDLDSAKNYTAWLVRANADEPFKVVRANVDGRGYQEPSAASKTIAVFMGENCYRVFGQ